MCTSRKVCRIVWVCFARLLFTKVRLGLIVGIMALTIWKWGDHNKHCYIFQTIILVQVKRLLRHCNRRFHVSQRESLIRFSMFKSISFYTSLKLTAFCQHMVCLSLSGTKWMTITAGENSGIFIQRFTDLEITTVETIQIRYGSC